MERTTGSHNLMRVVLSMEMTVIYSLPLIRSILHVIRRELMLTFVERVFFVFYLLSKLRFIPFRVLHDLARNISDSNQPSSSLPRLLRVTRSICFRGSDEKSKDSALKRK